MIINYISRKNQLLFFIVLFGFLRGSIITSGFPLFNNIDEFQHFDTIVKYSQSYPISPENEIYSNESIKYRALFHSDEYAKILNPEQKPGWTETETIQSNLIRDQLQVWGKTKNHECQQPPLYYLLLGRWFHFGSTIQVHPKYLLYSLRWSSLLFFCLLIITSFKISELVFSDRPTIFICLVPLFIASFPQDSLFMIGNDCLHPLLFSLALFYFLKKTVPHYESPKVVFVFSVLCIAAFFSKYSTVAVFFIFPMFLLISNKKTKYSSMKYLLLYMAIVCVPSVLWFGRNFILFDDLLGNMAGSGNWIIKPITSWLNHPIFSFNGFLFFIKRTLSSYWRGEVIWHGKWIQNDSLDLVYIITSLVLVPIGFVSLLKKERKTEALIFGSCLLFSVLFLIGCSIAFDFGDWFYPSRKRPFLVSGRLIMGTICPFSIFFIEGVFTVLNKKIRLTVFMVIFFLIGITIAEFLMQIPVFRSEFNWFHL